MGQKKTAADVMTRAVISVSPAASLLDVLQLFVDENIHGAPVVEEDGRLIGAVTTTDLLRAQAEEHDTPLSGTEYFRDLLEFSAPDWAGDTADFQDRLSQRSVADVMTKGVISVTADAPVADVARCLRENSIHRVWVEDAGGLCGVISALDLMQLIEEAG